MKKIVFSLVALTAISGSAFAKDSSSAWRNSFEGGYPATQSEMIGGTNAMLVTDVIVTSNDYAKVKSWGSDIRTERGSN
jgi:hypothetical protein